MSSAGGSMSSPSGSQATFDPSMATLILILGDGSNVTFPAEALDMEYTYDVQTTINNGSQLGASILLLILLPLLTKAEKRTSPIFALNCMSLFFNSMRLLLACLYYTGPWRGTYVTISNDYSSVPMWAYRLSIAALVFNIPLMITAQLSLVLQVQVVMINLRKCYRRLIFGLSVCMALCAIIFRIAGAIINAQEILSVLSSGATSWILGANVNATAASIFYFSAVFLTKLGLSLYQRHKMGLRSWGPMQILFIMGCQTLLVPAFLATLEYCPVDVPDMDSNILTAVVIFLPLSSLWAAASTSDASSRHNHTPSFRNRFADGSTLRGSNSHASSFFRKSKRSSPLTDTYTLETALESTAASNWENSPSQTHIAMHQLQSHEMGA